MTKLPTSKVIQYESLENDTIQPHQALTFSSSFIINEVDDRWQSIASSQNYGTNYGIFAKINAQQSDLGEKYFSIKNIEFKTINYKPTISVGIDTVVVKKRGSKTLKIQVYMKGLVNPKKTFDWISTDSTKIDLPKENSIIRGERILQPLFIVNKTDVDITKKNKQYFKRVLNKRTEDTLYSESSNKDGTIFDSEFFYKDGHHLVAKYDYDMDSDRRGVIIKDPGPRCREYNHKIIFSE
ncbi:hypothetical protein [uncultured Aquimarina sp.]|uniref:hypothetical protein n=1 Tax=uncultured Aquimarina sp. TaxID=575652 RepID=UPI00261985FD|nr:hypothetical protein [uncultured Aquimarina sp.]